MNQVQSRLETGDSHAFWEAARQGRLVFQRCAACGHVQHPPRYLCATCWSESLEQVDSDGRGTIESLTVVRRAPTQAFRAKVPYVVVAVAMTEGPRLIANLLGDGAMDARPDDRVAICFEPDDAGQLLPQFRLSGA